MLFGKFDYQKTPALLQGLIDSLNDGFGVRKLVIGMRNENQIQPSSGKAWAGFVAQHQFDVGELMLLNGFGGAIEHRLLYIHREDFAGRSNRPCQAPSVIASARSYVRDRRASGNLQR